VWMDWFWLNCLGNHLRSLATKEVARCSMLTSNFLIIVAIVIGVLLFRRQLAELLHSIVDGIRNLLKPKADDGKQLPEGDDERIEVEPLPLDYEAIAHRVIAEAKLNNIPLGEVPDPERFLTIVKSILKFLQVVSTITPNATDDKLVDVLSKLVSALESNPQLVELLLLVIAKFSYRK